MTPTIKSILPRLAIPSHAKIVDASTIKDQLVVQANGKQVTVDFSNRSFSSFGKRPNSDRYHGFGWQQILLEDAVSSTFLK